MTAKFKASAKNDKTTKKIRNIERSINIGIKRAFNKSGLALINSAENEILNGPKTGRKYTLGENIRKYTKRTRSKKPGRKLRKKEREHTSSARGESHAEITGQTRKSLSFQEHGVTDLEFGYGVSSPTRGEESAHGKFLENELGRTTLLNAIRDEAGNIAQHFEREIEEALK